LLQVVKETDALHQHRQPPAPPIPNLAWRRGWGM
jgi:hypothetical protein